MSFKGTSNKNFGGYNPTVYDRSRFNNVQQLRQIAMKDPWFAAGDVIGSALADAYANNYNNRGISKAVDKALAEYQTPSAADEQAALQQVQQQMLQPGTGSVSVGMSDIDALNSVRQNYGLDPMPNAGASIPAGGMPTGNQLAQSLKAASDQKHEERIQQNNNPSAYNEEARFNALQQPAGVSVGMSDADALNSVRQNYGLGALQPSGTDISVGDNIPQQDPQMMDALLGTARAAQPETREQAIERLAQMPGAAIVAQDNAARRLDNFNKAEAMLRAEQNMIKDGRTPYQIEQAMRILEPHFDRMQDESYRANAERIMAELGAVDETGRQVLSDADYKQKIIDLAIQYGDIGKAAANLYGRDIVSGQDRFRAQQQLERENRAAERRAAERAADRQAQIEIARIRGSRTGGSVYGRRSTSNRSVTGNTRSPLDSAEFKYMDNMVNRIAEVPEAERTAEQKRFFEQYKPLRDRIVAQTFGNEFDYHTPEERGGAAPRQNNFSFNNYDQAVNKFQALAKSGKFNRSEVESFIRSKYGLKPNDRSNKFVEDVINGIEW